MLSEIILHSVGGCFIRQLSEQAVDICVRHRMIFLYHCYFNAYHCYFYRHTLC